jgi:hypothetical protein
MRLHRASIELLDNHPGLLVRCVLPVQKQLRPPAPPHPASDA